MASAIYCLSRSTILRAVEIRQYALYVLLSLLLWIVVMRLARSKPAERRLPLWGGLAVLMIADAYTLYLAGIQIAAAAAYLAWVTLGERRLRAVAPLIVSLCIVGLVFLPQFNTMRRQSSPSGPAASGTNARIESLPSGLDMRNLIDSTEKIVHLSFFSPSEGGKSLELVYLAATIVGLVRLRRRGGLLILLLLLASLIVPIAAGLAGLIPRHVIDPSAAHRYTGMSVSLVAICAGAALMYLGRFNWLKALVVAGVAAVFALTFGTLRWSVIRPSAIQQVPKFTDGPFGLIVDTTHRGTVLPLTHQVPPHTRLLASNPRNLERMLESGAMKSENAVVYLSDQFYEKPLDPHVIEGSLMSTRPYVYKLDEHTMLSRGTDQ